MTFGLAFWVLMLVWLVFSFAYNGAPARFGPYGWAGGYILLFILFALLGWHDFGPPIHQ